MNLEQKGVIYKATNLVNGDMYIGLTTKKFRVRQVKHLSLVRKPRKNDSNAYFHNAIRKYGADNFKWEIIDIAPEADEESMLMYLSEREKFWIEFYDTYNNGYNLTKGGQGTLGRYHTDESKSKISKAKKGVSVHTEESKRKLSEASSGENHPFWGKFSKDAPRKRNVIQLTLEGEYVATYPTIKDAHKVFNQDGDGASIVQCCKGKYNSIFGFRWMYESDYKLYLKGELKLKDFEARKHGKRPIVQLTLDGEYIAEFETAKEYAISIGKKDGAVITGVCRGRYKTAYGFKWMYKDDYEKLKEEAS